MDALNVIQTQEGEYVLNDKEEVITQSIKFEVYGNGTKSEMTRAVWDAAPAVGDDGIPLSEVECTEIGESYAIVYARYKNKPVDTPAIFLAEIVTPANGYGAAEAQKAVGAGNGDYTLTGDIIPVEVWKI